MPVDVPDDPPDDRAREGGVRQRWLAAVLASAQPMRHEWRHGRLRLRGIAGADRLAAQLAFGVILVACATIVATSLGLSLPGLVTDVPGKQLATDAPVAVPSFGVLLACIGMAVAAAAIALGAASLGLRGGGLFFVLELTLAGLGGLILATAGAVRHHASIVADGNGLVVAPYVATGVLGLGAAVYLPLIVAIRPRWVRAVAPLVAAAPFVALAATIILAGDQHADVPPWVQAQFLDYPPRLYLTATIFAPVLFVVGSAAGLIALLTIWQASTFSKAAARHVGTALAPATSRWAWLLAALVAAKLAWLAAGLLGLLPPALGGTSEVWFAIRSDDAFAWFYAASLGIVATIWLTRGRQPLNENRAKGAAGRIVLAFAAASLLLAALPLVGAALAGVFPGTHPPVPDDITVGDCIKAWLPLGGSAAASCLGLALVEWQSVWWLAVIVAGFFAGLWILRRRRNDAGGVFLVALGAWAIPRAANAVRVEHPVELSWLARLPSFNAPQPETFDIVVTVGVAALAVAWWSGRQRTLGPAALLVVLAVSTLLIQGAAVAPSAPGAFLLAIAIVFPVLYELGFDSEEANRRTEARAGRVLQSLGVRAFALTVLATLVLVDVRQVQQSGQAQLGFILFGVPLGAVIVAASVRRLVRRRDVPLGNNPPDSPAARSLVVAGAAGAAALLAVAGLGWVVQPVLATIYPTAGARVEELGARFVSLDADYQAMDFQDPAAPGMLAARWATEVSWIADHQPPACAMTLWRHWNAFVGDIREVGVILAAIADEPPDAPPEEVAAVSGAIETTAAAIRTDRELVRGGLEAATADCATG